MEEAVHSEVPKPSPPPPWSGHFQIWFSAALSASEAWASVQEIDTRSIICSSHPPLPKANNVMACGRGRLVVSGSTGVCGLEQSCLMSGFSKELCLVSSEVTGHRAGGQGCGEGWVAPWGCQCSHVDASMAGMVSPDESP